MIHFICYYLCCFNCLFNICRTSLTESFWTRKDSGNVGAVPNGFQSKLQMVFLNFDSFSMVPQRFCAWAGFSTGFHSTLKRFPSATWLDFGLNGKYKGEISWRFC